MRKEKNVRDALEIVKPYEISTFVVNELRLYTDFGRLRFEKGQVIYHGRAFILYVCYY